MKNRIALVIALFLAVVAAAASVSHSVAVSAAPAACHAKARTVPNPDVPYWLGVYNSIGCPDVIQTPVGPSDTHLQPVLFE